MSVGKKFNKMVHCTDIGSKELIIPQAKIGIEVEVENWRPRRMPAGWVTHDDGSLRGGKEFVTDGGMVGKGAVEAVRQICGFCVASGFSAGYPRAGIHIHVDMTDMNDGSDTQLLNAVSAYLLFEDALFSFAGQWRRACGFCDPLLLSQAGRPALARFLVDWQVPTANPLRGLDKYAALNLLPLETYGTVEFRALPTTFDPERIINWINLCLAFKKFGKDIDKNPVELLDTLGVDGLTSAIFLDWYPVIRPHIDTMAVHRAAGQVCGLSAGLPLSIKTLKRIAPSWDPPTNPLLLKKIELAERKKDLVQPERHLDLLSEV